jgi:hypothetical protein
MGSREGSVLTFFVVWILSDNCGGEENNFDAESWKPVNAETFEEAIDRVVATTYLKKDSKISQINSGKISQF